MTAKEIGRDLLLKHPTMFRNDNGMAFVGGQQKYQATKHGLVAVRPGDIVIVNPNMIRYGLAPGSSDYIGWDPVVITRDMVGQKFARFYAAEIKTQNDRESDKQRNFLAAVLRDGGRAEVWQEKRGVIEILTGEDIT